MCLLGILPFMPPRLLLDLEQYRLAPLLPQLDFAAIISLFLPEANNFAARFVDGENDITFKRIFEEALWQYVARVQARLSGQIVTVGTAAPRSPHWSQSLTTLVASILPPRFRPRRLGRRITPTPFTPRRTPPIPRLRLRNR